MMRKIAVMTYVPLGMRTVRSTSEESGLVTSLEGEGEERRDMKREANAPLQHPTSLPFLE